MRMAINWMFIGTCTNDIGTGKLGQIKRFGG